MAYIDCPELSSVFGCDVVVHATQARSSAHAACAQLRGVGHAVGGWHGEVRRSRIGVGLEQSSGVVPVQDLGEGVSISHAEHLVTFEPKGNCLGVGTLHPYIKFGRLCILYIWCCGVGCDMVSLDDGLPHRCMAGQDTDTGLQQQEKPGMPSTGAAMGAMAMGDMGSMGAMGGLADVMGMGPMGAMTSFLDGMGLQGKHAAPINQEVLGEFYGIVKSYNPEKGFGFIVCDALKHQHDGDVYLHSRHIGDFKVGQEVKFQAYLHNGRLQGRELQDATGMVGPQTGAAPGLDTEQELGVFVGKIKNYNHEKGFGFIVCEALNLQGYQGDVFLHSKNKGTFEAGDEVAFMAVLRQGKLQGKDLQAASAVLGEMGIMAPTMGGMGGSMMGMMGMMSDMDPAAKRARMY
ncbi:unnamed protein product [Durusdinium trenchii]|uniref:CSD domain-containing protein n=2 Tax=Durusdinium trenchii TaxID=1381693 RepID=A0ABP0L822_9DINO